jgi:hypothetical protein
MKWYSVKKYLPPNGGTVIQRVINGNNIAYSEGRYNHDDGSWETFDDDYCMWEVTHFCTPGPIEVEE